MRKYLLATSVLAALATPAFADVSGPYVGVEGGVTFPRSTDLDVILNDTSATPPTTGTFNNGERAKFKTGYDLDAVAGYKLGLIKLEVEGGYKRAKIKSLGVSAPLITAVGDASGTTATAGDFDVGSHIGIKTLMANALLDHDFGNSRFGGYVGGGAGRAWASFSGDKDNAMAYQGIAGIRYALSPNVDAGLKYRYFRTASMNFSDAFTVGTTNFTTEASGKYQSHSLLASLVYNFNPRAPVAEAIPAAAPAPPPPPPEPATQTCADGSVILATSACPAPPPPPPPPVERGERGR